MGKIGYILGEVDAVEDFEPDYRAYYKDDWLRLGVGAERPEPKVRMSMGCGV